MDYLHHDTRCSRLSSFMISVAPSAEWKSPLSTNTACCIHKAAMPVHIDAFFQKSLHLRWFFLLIRQCGRCADCSWDSFILPYCTVECKCYFCAFVLLLLIALPIADGWRHAKKACRFLLMAHMESKFTGLFLYDLHIDIPIFRYFLCSGPCFFGEFGYCFFLWNRV